MANVDTERLFRESDGRWEVEVAITGEKVRVSHDPSASGVLVASDGRRFRRTSEGALAVEPDGLGQRVLTV
jgi:hypothetical protein